MGTAAFKWERINSMYVLNMEQSVKQSGWTADGEYQSRPATPQSNRTTNGEPQSATDDYFKPRWANVVGLDGSL